MSCRIIPRILADAWLVSIMVAVASGQTNDTEEKKGWLGVYTTSTIAQTVQQFDLTIDSGAVVEYVVAGGPAEKHGMREGDVIVKSDGQDISTAREFGNALYGKKAGHELVLEIQRDGTRQQVRVVMEECPSDVEFAGLHRSAAEKGHARAQMQLGRAYLLGEGVEKDYEKAMDWTRRASDQGSPQAQNILGYMYANGVGVEEDPREAIRWYRKAADQGYDVSQYNLALSYENGQGVEQDYAKAIQWYQEAAAQGYSSAQTQLGTMYNFGRGVEKDYGEARRWYRPAAEHGDRRAQNNLGLLFQNGRGVKRDYAEAVKWYRKAAEQGYSYAQANLADMYKYGRGVEQDYAEAMEWYRKAAEQGHGSAQYDIGNMYEFGKGVEKDYTEAVRWYRKGAEQEHARSQQRLGVMYEYGRGVDEDHAEAMRWYRKAAEQGEKSAQHNLAWMYRYGKGVEQDYAEALKWHRKAAEQDYAKSQNSLGFMYEFGQGVEEDDAEAVRWYRKAAEQDYARAQYSLADMYEFGKGVEQDYAEALKWYRKAAEQDHASAQERMGEFCYHGYGTERDFTEAVKWYRKAAEQNDEDAQNALGRMYEFGLGVDRNRDEAIQWYSKAAEAGVIEARDNLGNLLRSTDTIDPIQELVSAEIIPEDSAIVEVDIPAGASLLINGLDQGDERRLIFEPFSRGEYYSYMAVVRFRDGTETRRELLLHGGWKVHLVVPSLDQARPAPVLQTGHTASIHALRFDSDGGQLSTASADGTVRLWDIETGNVLRIVSGTTGGVESAAFSADGHQVLFGGVNGNALLLDLRSGNAPRRYALGQKEYANTRVKSAAFSPDGQHFLTGAGKDAILWDRSTARALRTFQGHRGNVVATAFSPDGRFVLTGDGWKTADLSDSLIMSIYKYQQSVFTLQQEWQALLTPKTGNTSSQNDREEHSAVLWDIDLGRKVRVFKGHSVFVNSVEFSSDGGRILTSSADGTAVLWDVATGKQLQTFKGHTKGIASARFSPDNRRVLTCSVDETAAIWDTASGRRLHILEPGSDAWVNAGVFSRDGHRVAIASWDGSAFVYDAATGEKIRGFAGYPQSVNTVVYTTDGPKAIIGHPRRYAVTFWDPIRESKHRTFQYPYRFVATAISPDGRLFACGHADGAAFLWDVTSGEELQAFEGHTDSVRAIAFSPNGQRVFTASEDGTVGVWDTTDGKKLHRFSGLKEDWGGPLAVSPDEKSLAVVDSDGLHVWDSTSGQQIRKIEGHWGDVVFTPDSRHVVVSSQKAKAQLWNISTGKLIRTYEAPMSGRTRIALSPDGRLLLTYYGGESVILWETETGNRLREYTGRLDSIYAIAFSPDGRRFVTGSGDGTARIWDVATGDELARLMNLDRGWNWLVTTPEGLFDGSPDSRRMVSYRIPGQLNAVPVDRFFQEFYRPGLLIAVERGERPMPDFEIGEGLPPRLKIISPESGLVDSKLVELKVAATDQGGGVSGLAVYHNNARVLARADSRREGETLYRTFHISLVEGENHLRITAASADGSWEAEPVEIVLTYEEPLDKSELHVLAIGASRYADANLNLNFAARDAQVVAELFRRRGGDLYANVHITEVVDKQATRKGITQALKKVTAATSPQDTLVVFLAGHGTMVGQRYYFVPHEMRRQEDLLEDDIRKQGLPADEISDYIGSASALKRLLIFDTCASGGALGSALKSRSGFALRGAIERLSRTQGVFTIAASAATEEAQESKDLGHGVLSYTLLAGLKAVEGGPLEGRHVQPSNPERVVDVMDWFSFAAGQVPRLTERLYGVSQDVQMSTQGTSFPVLPLDD